MRLKRFVVMCCFLLAISIYHQGWAEDNPDKSHAISNKDMEIIKNLDLLQNLDVLKEGDLSLLESYDDVDSMNNKDGGEYNAHNQAQ